MLEVFEHDWRITNEKINIVINKANIYEISESIIKELFPDLKIVGKMRYNDAYNLMVNRDFFKRERKPSVRH